MTLDKTVIMGRVTLESLPGSKGLPRRRNIVLTRDTSYEAVNAELVHSYEEIDEIVSCLPEEDVFVIGGAQIYKDMLPKCDICYVTKIYKDFDADRYFENLDVSGEFDCEPVGELMEEKV